MKKFLLWLLTLTVALPALASGDFSYTFKGQTLDYRILDEDAKTCAVAPSQMAFGAVEIPAIASDGSNNYTVTAILKQAFERCDGVTSMIIPNTVTSIGSGAFSDCRITEITIPNSVTSIDDAAFSWCMDLQEVTLSNSLTSISQSLFSRCRSLTQITIPRYVTSIGSYAFNGCSSLSVMRCMAVEPPVCEEDAFNGVQGNVVLVPAPSVETYRTAAQWSNFPAIIGNYKVGSENESLYIQSFFIQPGEEATMPVRLRADRQYTDFETYIHLPQGLEAVTTQDGQVDAQFARQDDTHTFTATLEGNNLVKVAVNHKDYTYTPIADATDGTLFNIRVRATDQLPADPVPVWFRNTTLVDTDGSTYLFNDSNPHINADGVMGRTDIEVAGEAPAIYYNLQGQPVATPQPGNIYIRLQSNKATKLVF